MFSEFSAFSALLFFTAYTLICCLICKKIGWRTLHAFGIGIGLLLLRCLLLIEIPGVELIEFGGWYADLYQWLNPYFAEGITPLEVLLIIWAVGSLIFLMRLVFRLTRQYKTILENAIGADHRLSQIYREVLQKMACASVGHINVSTDYQSPMMAGFFKPHILFPADMAGLPEEELKFIFRHEITHFKKRDLWIKLLVELLCCALWWNPVVYMLRICISQLLEMRCDSSVCEKLNQHQQLEYSQTLLNSFKKPVHYPIYVTAEYLGYPSKERLKQRFTQILSAPSQPEKKVLSILIVTLSICAFIGSYAAILVPGGLPDGIGSTLEISSSFESAFILRYPDGELEVFVDNQLFAKIDSTLLTEEPYCSMPIIDANPSPKEE